MSVLLEILSNRIVQGGFLAWAIAQALKVILTLIVTRKFDSSRMFGSGGMPSSHSALAYALVTVIGYQEGFSSSVFALAFAFASIVIPCTKFRLFLAAARRATR